MLAEGGIVRGEDDPRRLGTEPPHDERHHRARQQRREPSTHPKHHAVEPSEAAKVRAVDQLGEPPRGSRGNGDTRNLVGEADGEVSRSGIPHEHERAMRARRRRSRRG